MIISIKRLLLWLVTVCLLTLPALAEVQLHTTEVGDYQLYLPKAAAKNILVLAHGMLGKNQQAAAQAKIYTERWIPYAEKYGLIIIAPAFDNERFGNLSQGYGGYRNLFGKYIGADDFVHQLVEQYRSKTQTGASQFYLYGHSAGGQFVARYVVTHPERVIKAVISAAGRYSYPDDRVPWPYGAGRLNKKISWDSGAVVRHERVSPQLLNYAKAADKTQIVIGALDTKAQDRRAAHIGSNRIEFAHSWAEAVNDLATHYDMKANIKVHLVAGIGHDSAKLTPKAASLLFADLNR
ncbi:alpha/beta fold hydrolase [Rheinheimera baltica]|uniref:Alpha/beta fold hydrolase n=1 Tax=Rheinheimera baltica TaxID=67576 RepID=A0ABT9I3A1_9GAMM|nr:alpha/beta fold hydrolase [Rheinheimera baltica]MDP5137861.1 alpha/beta fold hydrolase [Rheinheimera baltica]